MTFFILDPNLTESGGHHFDWDMAIAEVARKRDEKVVIFAHKSRSPSDTDGVSITPWFAHTCYEKRSTAPYTGKFDDFRYFNDALADELAALTHQRFSALDCVLAPTLTELHMLGYVSWMKTFNPLSAPLFVVHLMFPSGLSVAFDSPPRIVDSEQALYYGLAFQKAAEPGPNIQFYGGGRQIAREFAELSGLPVEPHPIPWPLSKRAASGPKAVRNVLVYAGDAKAEKGFRLVPEIIETLASAYPTWTFFVHANEATAWSETRVAFDKLVELSQQIKNFQMKSGRLARAEYDQLLRQADCMISTYDPQHYARKSSGVLWEAIGLGLPVLAPAETWLSKEAEEWGAGTTSYQPHSAPAICMAFHDFASRLEALSERSHSAASLFRARNGPVAVFNQFADLWAARWMAAKLVGQPVARELPLAEQGGEGLYATESIDGSRVRWTGREFDIAFEWDFASSWELTLTAPVYIGAEQVLKARASASDGEALPLSAKIENGIGSIVVCGPGSPADGGGGVNIRFTLPWTYRPEGENRDLGILLRDLSVGPTQNERTRSERDSGIRILSPARRSEDDAIILEGVLTGAVALEPCEDANFAVTIKTDRGADILRATEFFVNGVTVPLSFVGMGKNIWRVSAAISRNIVILGGYATQWDLVNARAGTTDIVLSHLSFVQREMAFHQDAGRPAFVEDPEPRQTSLEASVIIGSIIVDNFIPGPGDYSHIGLSLFNVSSGADSWNHIKFNFSRYKGVCYVEFRNKSDWPRVFNVWPGYREDNFGQYVKFPDPEANGSWPSLMDARDLAIIRILFDNLPDIVRSCSCPELESPERNRRAKEAADLRDMRLRDEVRAERSEPSPTRSDASDPEEARPNILA